MILWVLILLCVRETKGKTLEELDQVFAIPAKTHAVYGVRQILYGVKKYLLFQNPPLVDLYEMAVENKKNNAGRMGTRNDGAHLTGTEDG